ncbi:flagellum-specific ATP synthase [Phyllobacterium ifriqiyense]|uniref:Flagellum-specific ATP synthase n=1 Tax=Phyllobacterium ifriqiyense TaxID=314238 RepID=A0ABU0S4G8_9HYPH|nr:flagellar protein export ATPase FliI [Phyllobacterium ifriqiyense]MDQ0995655.1 flagellum-specific ATP synthase [Phyllobacterium ifriqiyense]
MTALDSALQTMNTGTVRLDSLARLLSQANRECGSVAVGGYVNEVSRSAIGVRGISDKVQLGDLVMIRCDQHLHPAEVVRLEQTQTLIKPFDDRITPSLGSPVFPEGQFRIAPAPDWKGRVINALGEPLDGKGLMTAGAEPVPVDCAAPSAMNRNRVEKGLRSGVNVVDVFVPMCFGQRMGIFAGSGVGKSTLLAMMTKAADFDTVVLALTGERGREVRDMLEDTMAGKLDKTIAVIATGDESPMMRRLAPNTATAIAEYFRDRGDNVLLIVDSITRFAHAAREIAIAAGEPPVSRGYPPSVFSQLPRLLERAGPGLEGQGTITGLYAVLVDGDDHNDPISDAIRGTLDGHIVLDRTIAAQGRFPAVDILGSISRLAHHNWSPDQAKLATGLRSLISRFEETRDLRMIGAYQTGSDPQIDQAVHLVPLIYGTMQQTPASPLSQDPYSDLATALRPTEPS